MAVRRALDSIARHCSHYGRRPRLLVVDGSRHASNRRATRAAAAAVGRSSGHSLEYLGPAEASRFRRRIASDHAGFVAGPGAYGASRNLVLLLTAGEHVLSIDDDMVCDTWALPAQTGRLVVTGHRLKFLRAAFYSSRRAAISAVRHRPIDLVGAHEALIGRQVSELLDEWSPAPDATHACSFVRSALDAERRLAVRVTFAGTTGDAGTTCSHRVLFSSGDLRRLLWSSEPAFADAIGTRETSRIASRYVVTHGSGCMAGCMALSNRAALPPFMPFGRNEDGVFGATLATCDPLAMFGHVPVGIVHDSDRPSRRPRGRVVSASETRIGGLLLALIPTLVPSKGTLSPRVRMRLLGRALSDVGRLRPRDLARRSADLVLDVRAVEWRHAQEALDEPDCPAYWRRGLARYDREYRKSLTRPEFFLPVEFHDLGSLDAGWSAVGRFLRDYGELIERWPELWDRAKELNGH